jgi:tetratricopeptide (TPR) repeat protein
MVAACWAADVGSAVAEDFVTVRSKDGQRISRRAGTIDDLTGEKLTLVSANGQTESIPFDRVVEISTEWSIPHRNGDALRKEGKLDQAVSAYRQAKRVESRPWGVRQIQAHLVECLFARGDVEDAGDEFLAMMGSDPQSPYFAAIPLAWRNSAGDGGIEVRARAWLNQKSTVATLLGASWLLGADRKAASAKLEALAKDLDPRVAKLAEAQLWRANRPTAKATDVRRWKATLGDMPDALRPGPSLIVGEVQLRLGEVDDALALFWEPAILHPEQLALSAEGLFLAARGAHQAGRETEAKAALTELWQHCAGTTFDADAAQWAKQVGLPDGPSK